MVSGSHTVGGFAGYLISQLKVHGEAVKAIRDRRACRAAAAVLGAEHEVIDEKLRASSEQIGERRHALLGLETVLLVDSNPRQPLLPLRQFVATPRQRLLGLEQLQPGRKPLFTCSDLVVNHCFSPSCRLPTSCSVSVTLDTHECPIVNSIKGITPPGEVYQVVY
jgi:hypothetical protein